MAGATGKVLALARRARGRAPMEELSEARITLEGGLEGDFRGTRRAYGGGRQVTVLSVESWRDVCAELGAELPWTTRRANLLVEGLALAESVGRRLAIGPVELEVTEEVDPCARMDEQHAGLTEALRPAWRGGVGCRVVTGGTIEIGDEISLS